MSRSVSSNHRHPFVMALACAMLLSLPLWLVELVPSTDLPQLLAQLQLLQELPDGFEIQWWHPNKLGYLPLAVGWVLGDPFLAGRIGMGLVILSWVLVIHLIARKRRLEPGRAVLASLLVFNISFHWGFVNFLLGLPVFLLFFRELERAEEGDAEKKASSAKSGGWRLLGLGVLLYAAHVLWLAMALIWLVVRQILERSSNALDWRAAWNSLLRRLVWLSPVLGAVALWYFFFRTTGVDQRLFWGQMPWQRLHPTWLIESLFGGLQGVVEPALVTAIVLWLALGLFQHRNEPAWGIDRRLLAAAGLFFAATFFLPSVYHHTILFAARWLAPAAVLLILAVPTPKLSSVIRVAVPWLLSACLAVSLTSAWLGFEAEELDGFFDSLHHVAYLSRDGLEGREIEFLGLDFVRTSPRLDGFPYHHLPIYAEAFHRVVPHRTFADDPASLVVFETLPHEYAWTDRLDWKPQQLRASDFDHFDLFLALGGPELHARFDADSRLERYCGEAECEPTSWRLYLVMPNIRSDITPRSSSPGAAPASPLLPPDSSPGGGAKP